MIQRVSVISIHIRCIVLCWLLAVTGCASVSFPRIPKTAEKLSQVELGRILDGLAEREEALTTYRAAMEIQTLQSAGQKELQGGRMTVVLRDGTAGRIDFLPPGVAYALGIVAFEEGRGVALDIVQKQGYEGPVTPREMAALFGIRVAPEVFLRLLAGLTASPTTLLKIKGWRLSEDTVVVEDKERMERYVIDSFGRPIEVLLGDRWGGSGMLKIMLEYRLESAQATPDKSALFVDTSELLGLRTQQFKVGQRAPDSLFHLSIPNHYERFHR